MYNQIKKALVLIPVAVWLLIFAATVQPTSTAAFLNGDRTAVDSSPSVPETQPLAFHDDIIIIDVIIG